MRAGLIGLWATAIAVASPARALDIATLQLHAQGGSVAAERDLGLAYRRGQVGPVNAEAARLWLRKAADQGDTEAEYQLSEMYFGEYGITPDRAQALEWLTRAANAGNGKAEAQLYSLYRARAGEPGAASKAGALWPAVERDLVKAANSGDPDAQVMMCQIVEIRGNDIGPDGQKPVFESVDACRDWAEKARVTYLQRAQDGDEEAAAIAGANMEIMGVGGPANANGRALIKQAADAGVVRAMNVMAMFGLSSAQGHDPSDAIAYLHRAADAQSVSALVRFASMYLGGEDVDKDVPQSVALYRRAAEAGSSGAQLMLGMLYSDHGGEHLVTVDMDKALKWYGLAARQGDVTAQLHLSILYYEGRQIPQDKVRAYAWQLITNDFVAARNTTAVLTLVGMRSDYARIQNLENDLTPDEKALAEAMARDLRGQLE